MVLLESWIPAISQLASNWIRSHCVRHTWSGTLRLWISETAHSKLVTPAGIASLSDACHLQNGRPRPGHWGGCRLFLYILKNLTTVRLAPNIRGPRKTKMLRARWIEFLNDLTSRNQFAIGRSNPDCKTWGCPSCWARAYIFTISRSLRFVDHEGKPWEKLEELLVWKRQPKKKTLFYVSFWVLGVGPWTLDFHYCNNRITNG
jgi:hypothetical protein